MSEAEQGDAQPPPRTRAVTYLLTQLGAHAAQRFAELISDLDLTPPDIGLLRMIATQPGRSQRSLSAELGVVPSRIVTLIDHLDRKGLVERRRGATDRRNHELHLTPKAQQLMGQVWQLGQAHEADICASLNDAEYEQLATLLNRIADQQHLKPGVHPGYRRTSLPPSDT
ncbi:MarR family winged helix-turn-helix transcriptional regulator [Nocardia sp. NPDC004604]|uniref:MarR family winged helix-turn-helix transcriptional regulator n=1 Tax=Nocardia sp. NPDC004604 TaxID=3157013 RepID=UPI0033A58253